MNIFEMIAISKNLVNRTIGYLAVINAFAVLLTFKKVYDIPIPTIPLVIVGVIGIFIVGYIDYKFVMSYETIHVNRKNNINHKVDKILELLEKKRE